MSRGPRLQPPTPVASDRVRAGIELCAVLVSVGDNDPQVLALRAPGQSQDTLPSGPLRATHRTLEAGLRAWIAEHTQQTVGHVEQLYTFGDSNRVNPDDSLPGMAPDQRALSIGYLALIPSADALRWQGARWRSWYEFFPWEDWRAGAPACLGEIRRLCESWVRAAGQSAERTQRQNRLHAAFGKPGDSRWSDERVLERYELLYEIGLVAEAPRDALLAGKTLPAADGIGAHGTGADASALTGVAMAADHRRIVATAMARLRGKLKYRPVVFDLIPAEFTLSRLQETIESLTGMSLHGPNFRRLVDSLGLVEETGRMQAEGRGRPARLVRFRREIQREHPGLAGRLPMRRDDS